MLQATLSCTLHHGAGKPRKQGLAQIVMDYFNQTLSEDEWRKLSQRRIAAAIGATQNSVSRAVIQLVASGKAMLDAPDGVVFQATGPMPTSYDGTATSGFGKHRMRILCAKGAKALPSFGSGAFPSEKEVTMLPNSRFVLLNKKMVGKALHFDVLLLPPEL